MEEKSFKIMIGGYGAIFICIGIAAYMDAGISTGNYLLATFPLGLGLLLGVSISSVLDKFALRGN